MDCRSRRRAMFRSSKKRNSTARFGALPTGLSISTRSYRAISRQRRPKACAFAMAARSKPFARWVSVNSKLSVMARASRQKYWSTQAAPGRIQLPRWPEQPNYRFTLAGDICLSRRRWIGLIASWPFVWDVSHDIYFRPEGEGLLLCACDQQELPPGDPPVDETVQELLAEKIQNYIPALSRVSISKGWAGFRTLSADGRFVIGWDPKVKGLFWVAGLGGHGVTTSSAVGTLAAELILGGPDKRSDPFSPHRFMSA